MRHKLAKLNRFFFRDKKILIVTDHRIVNIPLSGRLQKLLLLVVGVMLTWASYSSGRYVAYRELVAEKERQVLQTANANEELKALYASLQTDLIQLYGYLDMMGAQVPEAKTPTPNAKARKPIAKPTVKTQPAPEAKTQVPVSEIVIPEASKHAVAQQTQDIVRQVDGKLGATIQKFESTIAATGLKLSELLKEDPIQFNRSAKLPMGGPLIPAAAPSNPTSAQNLAYEFAYLLKLHSVANSMPLELPLKNPKLSSYFGMRIDPFTRRWAAHYGLDIYGAYRTNVFATAPGIVRRAGRWGSYGKMVEIAHGYGVTTRYGHMDRVVVEVGDIVDVGQPIGVQGNTGRSASDHLHYEVRFRDEPMDPLQFIWAGGHDI